MCIMTEICRFNEWKIRWVADFVFAESVMITTRSMLLYVGKDCVEI